MSSTRQETKMTKQRHNLDLSWQTRGSSKDWLNFLSKWKENKRESVRLKGCTCVSAEGGEEELSRRENEKDKGFEAAESREPWKSKELKVVP